MSRSAWTAKASEEQRPASPRVTCGKVLQQVYELLKSRARCLVASRSVMNLALAHFVHLVAWWPPELEESSFQGSGLFPFDSAPFSPVECLHTAAGFQLCPGEAVPGPVSGLVHREN